MGAEEKEKEKDSSGEERPSEQEKGSRTVEASSRRGFEDEFETDLLDKKRAASHRVATRQGDQKTRASFLSEEDVDRTAQLMDTLDSNGGKDSQAKDQVTNTRMIGIELRTASGVLVEPPHELRRQDENCGNPGAYSVDSMGARPTDPPPQIEPASSTAADEEVPPIAASSSQPDDILIEASLVQSNSQAFEAQRSGSVPILAHARPMDDNVPLTWRAVCTSPKVLALLCVIIIVAGTVGTVLGVQRAKGNEQETTLSPSVNPAAWPTQDPFDATLPQTTLDAIQEPASPQARANLWMLQDDKLATYSEARQRQRFALVTFYYSTNGDNWIDRGRWLNYSVSECFWGMKATLEEGFDVDFDIFMDEDYLSVWEANQNETLYELSMNDRFLACSRGHAGINLILTPNNLAGTLPPEVFQFLPNLEVMDLSWNPLIRGTMPTEVGLLSRLRILTVADTSLSSTLPSELGKLERVQILDVYHNQMIGTIPTEIGLCFNLEFLFLGNNRLSGSLPSELGLVGPLHVLEAEYNDLVGSIPTELLFPGSRLVNLMLSGTTMDSTLPSEIENLVELETLMLRKCGLMGKLPNVTNLRNLKALDLSNNGFTGSIITGIGQLTRLEHVFLEKNALTGRLPTEIGSLGRLETLQCNSNPLSGSLPTTLGQLVSLVSLDFSNTQVSGMIPSELGLPDRLQEIGLEDTLLTGSIPDELCMRQDEGLLDVRVNCSSVECCPA